MYRESPSLNSDGHVYNIDPSVSNTSSSDLQPAHQAMLERLIEASPAFIFILDIAKDRCVYASPNLKQMFGHSHEDIIRASAQKMLELTHEADSEKVSKAEIDFMEAVSNFPSAQRRDIKSIMNYRIRRGDGGLAWVQQQKVIFETDKNGEPALVMSLITDISVTRKCHEFFSSVVYRDANKGWIELGAEHPGQKLSNREAQILGMLSKGKSSKIIADELSISVNTVNNHRKNMLLKTGTNNIAELVSYGLSQGVI